MRHDGHRAVRIECCSPRTPIAIRTRASISTGSRGVAPAGTRLKCTWIEIPPGSPKPHAVLLSRPYWMWGAEMGTNEHGVTIGNEAVFTREPYAASGLTGMDLLRLALERSAHRGRSGADDRRPVRPNSAKAACAAWNAPASPTTTASSWPIPPTAFVLETAGRHHAVEEIQGARSISNGLTIPGFAERHSDRIKTHVSACRLRQARTQRLVERAEGLADLMRALRDHGGRPRRARVTVAQRRLWRVPCVHAGGLLAASQTTASWVAELRPAPFVIGPPRRRPPAPACSSRCPSSGRSTWARGRPISPTKRRCGGGTSGCTAR